MMEDTETVEEIAILELTFVAPLPKECRCYLCDQLMRSPCHLTCCNSRYCQKCVDRMISAKNACKKCHSKWYQKETSSDDMSIKQVINKLHVYCPMKIKGCLWAGKLQDLETHLLWNEFKPDDTANCRYLPVPCPKCDVSVPRRDMVEHQKVSCEYRQAECQFCHHWDTATRIESLHREKCLVRPVGCTNGCGMPGIKEAHLTDHLLSECPLRYIACDYSHIGCDQQFRYKDTVRHNERFFQEHFRLMSEKVRVLGGENEELRSLALSVQHTCTKLQEQYDTLMSLLMRGGGGGEGSDPSQVQQRRSTLWPGPATVAAGKLKEVDTGGSGGAGARGIYFVVNQGDSSVTPQQTVGLPDGGGDEGSLSPPPIFPREPTGSTATIGSSSISGPPTLPRRTNSMLETSPPRSFDSESASTSASGHSEQPPVSPTTGTKRSYPISVKPPRFSDLLRQSSSDALEVEPPESVKGVVPLPPRPPKDVSVPAGSPPAPYGREPSSSTSAGWNQGVPELEEEEEEEKSGPGVDAFDLPPPPPPPHKGRGTILPPSRGMESVSGSGSGGSGDPRYNSLSVRPKRTIDGGTLRHDPPYDVPPSRPKRVSQTPPSGQDAAYDQPGRKPEIISHTSDSEKGLYDLPRAIQSDQGQGASYDLPPTTRRLPRLASYDSLPSQKDQGKDVTAAYYNSPSPRNGPKDTVYYDLPPHRARRPPPAPPERVHSSSCSPLKRTSLLPSPQKSRNKSVPNLAEADGGLESLDTAAVKDYQLRSRSWSSCEGPYVTMGSVSSINRYETHKGYNSHMGSVSSINQYETHKGNNSHMGSVSSINQYETQKGYNRRFSSARDDFSDSVGSQESIAESVFKSEANRIAQLPEEGPRISSDEEDQYNHLRSNTRTVNGAYVINENQSNIRNETTPTTITTAPSPVRNRDSGTSLIEVCPNPVYRICPPPSIQSELEQKLLNRRTLINQ